MKIPLEGNICLSHIHNKLEYHRSNTFSHTQSTPTDNSVGMRASLGLTHTRARHPAELTARASLENIGNLARI
jgi:hypothetical protein